MITSSFPRYEGDYFGPWILEYCRELVKQDYRVIVVAPRVEDENAHELTSDILTIERFNYWFPIKNQKLVAPPGMIPQLKANPLRIFQIPFLLLNYYIACSKIIKNNKIDIIHCQWIIPSGFIGSLLRAIHKIPLVITSQGAELFLSPYHPFSWFTKWTISRSDKIFPVSKQMSKRLKRFGCPPNKIKVIPNSINSDKFTATTKSKFKEDCGLPNNAKVIFTARRLVSEKRVDDLIQGFSKAELSESYYLVIAGDGPSKKELIHLAEILNITQKVIFLDFIDNSKLPEYYASSDIYVLSSKQEGLSLSLLEAMSSEMIVVSTKATGGNEVIQHKINGFLYEIGNIDELANILRHISQLSETQEKEIKENSRRTVLENYSVQKMVASWVKQYSSLP